MFFGSDTARPPPPRKKEQKKRLGEGRGGALFLRWGPFAAPFPSLPTAWLLSLRPESWLVYRDVKARK